MPSSSTSSSDVRVLATPYAPPASLPAPEPAAPSRRGPGALLVRVLLLLAIAAMPVAFSAWIDPARLVSARDEEEAMARVLVSGRNVIGFANYDDRAIERALAELRPGRAGTLGVGSSRLQPLPSSALPGQRFVNVAVQGAMLDDLLGVYGLYDTPERRPERLLLNVDPWTQSYRGEPGWASVARERFAVMQRSGIPVSPWREELWLKKATLQRLASPEYLRHAVFSFRTYGVEGSGWTATDGIQHERKTKRPDGSVVWPPLPPDNGPTVIPQFVRTGLPVDGRLQGLDARVEGREDALEKFVRYVKGQGVEVTVLLVPFPPEMYEALLRLPGHNVVAVETELRAMASRVGVRVVGGYDPRPFGLRTEEFFDETHLRPEALARVVLSAR